MLHSVDRWALSGNLWILVSVASLSMFIFIIVYLYILYPKDSFVLQTAASATSNASAASAAAVASSSAPLSAKIISADGEISVDTDPHTELSRFFQRVIGHGRVNENGEVNTKLRPFRSLGFLFVVLPSAYMMYRNKMREDATST